MIRSDLETTGPLMPHEAVKLHSHALSGMGLYEVDKQIEWLEKVIKPMKPTDLARARMERELALHKEYKDLIIREMTYGVSTVVTLGHPFAGGETI